MCIIVETIKYGRSLTYVTLNDSAGFRTHWVLQLTALTERFAQLLFLLCFAG